MSDSADGRSLRIALLVEAMQNAAEELASGRVLDDSDDDDTAALRSAALDVLRKVGHVEAYAEILAKKREICYAMSMNGLAESVHRNGGTRDDLTNACWHVSLSYDEHQKLYDRLDTLESHDEAVARGVGTLERLTRIRESDLFTLEKLKETLALWRWEFKESAVRDYEVRIVAATKACEISQAAMDEAQVELERLKASAT